MKAKRPVRREAPPPPPVLRRSPLAWLVMALLVLVLSGQTVRLRDRLAAGRMLRQVELLSMAAIARNELPRGLVAANMELLRRASALDPTEIGIPIARGTQYLLLGNGSSAVQAYRDALALEPRPEIYLNLGRALAASGRTQEAREQFRTALRLDPNLAQVVPSELR